MTDDTQLPPSGGATGFSAVAVQPEPEGPGRALLTAVLLIVAGAILGLLGGVVWAAAAPRVVYEVTSLNPPTAFAVNPETNAFIAADGIYTFVALGGGALLGLVGYLFGVRRYGPLPMVGIVIGAVAAAFLAAWVGNVQTGAHTFNATLSTSKRFMLLKAPISLGSHGALAFWPVAAALVAGGLELLSVMRARRLGRARATAFPPPPYGQPFGSPGPTQPSQWPTGPDSPPPGRYGMPGTDQPPAPGRTDT